MRFLPMLSCLFALGISSAAYADVAVNSPADGSTTGTSVTFQASGSAGNCSLGVASIGIYVDDSLLYVAATSAVNTRLQLSPGKHKAVIQAWDYCGGVSGSKINLRVTDESGVAVTSPVTDSTVSANASYVASATTSCSAGVAAIGVYVDDQLSYVTPGSQLNTQVALTPGKHKTTVQEWDNCGGTNVAPINVSVTGTTMYNLQAADGWNQWGELNPIYDICNAPCNGVTWQMNQHIAPNSLSGDATQYVIGGTTPYSDVLWSNPVLGQGAAGPFKDQHHTLLPTLHNFNLDTYVYVTNFAVTQDLEFDINMYANGVGMEWGTECNHLDHKVWDIWDNVNAVWVPTSIPCVLYDKAWNHVVLQVQRQPNNDLLYQTLTVNGTVYNLNITVAPFPVPAGWWGMTVNYQMDGNYNQSPNVTYLDKTNFTYW